MSDGKEKQDCETNAGKRLLEEDTEIPSEASLHRRCRLPLQQAADHRGNSPPQDELRPVAKPEDHKKLMEWVNEMRVLKEIKRLAVKEKECTSTSTSGSTMFL